MDEAKTISVEVAYAEPTRQILIAIELAVGSTVEQALEATEILKQIPNISQAETTYGIHGQICQTDKTLSEGDRVEIYRPLSRDPMTARRQRI